MKKILVIEDDPMIRETVVDILESENYSIQSAENGKIGIEKALTFLPDLIISDIMMPEVDGYGVFNEIKKNPITETTAFLFMSAKSDKSDIREAMNLGADDYLTKPFDIDVLLKTVSLRLKKKETLEQKAEQKVNELRMNLTHSLPHEFRTPLNGIIGLSDLIISKIDTLEKSKILEMQTHIKTSARTLQTLLEKFLYYSKLEIINTDENKKRLLLHTQIKSINSILEQLISLHIKDETRKKDIELSFVDGNVSISPEYLSKIVEEIMSNIFKFSNTGNKIIIKSFIEQNKYHIHFKNFGKGMTQEQIANIGAYMQFERKQLEQPGTGLGLIIVKKIVELHRGIFSVESIPDEYAIIKIELPIYELQKED